MARTSVRTRWSGGPPRGGPTPDLPTASGRSDRPAFASPRPTRRPAGTRDAPADLGGPIRPSLGSRPPPSRRAAVRDGGADSDYPGRQGTRQKDSRSAQLWVICTFHPIEAGVREMGHPVTEHRAEAPAVAEPGRPDRLGHADAGDGHLGRADRGAFRVGRAPGRRVGRSCPTSQTDAPAARITIEIGPTCTPSWSPGGRGSARATRPSRRSPPSDEALPGYGELFRMLSYAEIGSATMRSAAPSAA